MTMRQPTLPIQSEQSRWRDIFFLSLVLGVLFFALLGVRPLFVPDEGRYAEIAREMVQSSDYLTPHLNGIKYFEKPALFYWLEAAAIKGMGLTIWSVRSVNALLGLAGCLLTYLVTRKLFDRLTGLLAAFILGTSLLYFVMTHMVSLDLPVTFFLTSCLYAFLLATETQQSQKRRLYLIAAAAASALAVLTKGLIGLVFPGLIVLSWIIVMGNWRIIKKLFLPTCLFTFLLISLPWHVLVGLRNPEFFYFYFIEQHFLRYTTLEVGHYQPAWFFIPTLILGLFPWIVFLPQALFNAIPTSWNARKKQPVAVFLLLWAVLVFAFFSFSKSKLIPYILPVLPPLAILIAHYLATGIKQSKFNAGIKTGYTVLIIFTLAIAYVFYVFPKNTLLSNANEASVYLTLASALLLVGVIFSTFSAYRERIKIAVNLTLITLWLFLLAAFAAVPAIDTRTIRPIASALKPLLHPEDEVITYNQYYQDLPFYLERTVSILNWHNELTYGMKHQDTQQWMINDKTFWQRFNSKNRVFVVMSLEEYQNLQRSQPHPLFYVLTQTKTNVLISNHPSS